MLVMIRLFGGVSVGIFPQHPFDYNRIFTYFSINIMFVILIWIIGILNRIMA